MTPEQQHRAELERNARALRRQIERTAALELVICVVIAGCVGLAVWLLWGAG